MKKKLLLVDDEKDIREILYIYLADLGYEVLTAENGIKALEIFRKEKPPIVITDIKMDGMDGISLLRRIKKEAPPYRSYHANRPRRSGSCHKKP